MEGTLLMPSEPEGLSWHQGLRPPRLWWVSLGFPPHLLCLTGVLAWPHGAQHHTEHHTELPDLAVSAGR